jgi:dolichol-phosphate mannosyltransferase
VKSGKSTARATPTSVTGEKFALVIPTLQEAENLPELLRRVLCALDMVPLPSEVIVVDDDSRDGTKEIVEQIALYDNRVRVLVRKGERGLAGAVLHGWRHTDASLLGVMDADLQHPPELLPQLIAALLCGADLSVASRYKSGGSTGNWNAARRLVSSSATWLTRPLLPAVAGKLRVQDPMSGFFAIHRECVEGLTLQTTGFKLLFELLVRAEIRNVSEVSFSFGVRNAGESKASLQVAREYARLLLRLYGESRARRRALALAQKPVPAAGAFNSAIPKLADAVAPREFLHAEDTAPELVPELSSFVLQ